MDRDLVRGHHSTQYTPVRLSAEKGVTDPSQRGKSSVQEALTRVETMGCGSEG